jgi:endonuclease/exonuclease/phosphatase (EEP) superfamily protein YafD
MHYKKFFPEIYSSTESLQLIGGACQTELGYGPIRLLVWNMYKGRYRGWSDDFQTLIQDKELVLLQESIFHTKHDLIFQNPECFEWVMARTHRSKITEAATGIKTGAVVHSSAQIFFTSPDMEPIFKIPKMLLATTYPLAGYEENLLVVNIHAVNFVSFPKYNRQIKQIVEATESHKGPVILAGDFNTWSKLRSQSLRDIAAHIGLQEVSLTRRGRLHHFNQHLDHVFYRGLELQKAEVLLNINTSDHYPISVEFRLPSL